MDRREHRSDQPVVCLLSTHPLLLEEFTQKLSESEFTAKAHRLRSVFLEDLSHLAVPRANVYVVDGHNPFAAAMVGALAKRFPDCRVIVLAEKFTDENAFSLLEQGAKGLLNYSEASQHLPDAVTAVLQGRFWVQRHLLSKFKRSAIRSAGKRTVRSRARRLSPREREVLECLLESLSNKEIARKLDISERTAKFHVSNLLAKFDVRRRSDLLMLQFHDYRQ